MAVLLVTYDLNKPGQDYSDFLKVVKSYAYAKLSESSYAIESEESPQDVYNKLCSFIDRNDRLAVISLSSPWHAFESQEVIDWLTKRL